MKTKARIKGLLAAAILLAAYFAIVSFISGFDFAASQFSQFFGFIIALAIGFGVQFGLYSYLKEKAAGMGEGKVVAVTGATSTAAMVSCCAHYLANIVPLLGVTAFATFLAQYQVRFFWAGILMNFLGIAFIINRIRAATVHHQKMS
jgi:Cu+-exporting ATPase